jgi:hypothetical protein
VSPADPLAVAASAAQGFQVLQCQECADKVKATLVAAGHHGEVVELRGGAGKRFMACLSYDGGQTTITENGRHVGVRVGDVAFDNLHPNGVPYDQWLQDFDAIGGIRIHAVTAF